MIAIIDYNAGNLTSVLRAFSHIGAECKITDSPDEILKSERLVFPGVGAAGFAMASLKKKGLDKALKDFFHSNKPMLGICLGAQIIMSFSEENNEPCLDIIKGKVCAFPLKMQDKETENFLKIPHMGWNKIKTLQDHPVLEGIREDDAFYFVHSFYPLPEGDENIFAASEYGISFPSIVGKNNLIATQFHLEKSGKSGLMVLKNFCNWKIGRK
jgi:imidazole glycerol-phosphate synthase subunit HisH